MMLDEEDDFDRFCRISGGMSEYSPGRKEFLAAPELSRNRTGSLRERTSRHRHPNHPSYQRGYYGQPEGDMTYTDHSNGHSSLRRHSLAPNFSNMPPIGPSHHESSTFQFPAEDLQQEYVTFSPVQKITPPHRNGSSPGIQPPPINVYHEIDSPEHAGLNIARVRSFRRTKQGVVDETELKRRPSQEFSTPPRRGSKTRTSRSTTQGELRLSDRCETASSIRRMSFNGSGSVYPTITMSNSHNFTAECSDSDVVVKNEVPVTYKVQVLGAEQVGKTTMCTQFLTSESLDAGFDSADEGNVLETITVDVDGQQTSLLLIDSGGYGDDSNFTVIDSADAYLVVFAIDDRESFKVAQMIISEILGRCKIASAIVLVGNKADLVRARTVSYDEGKHLASVYSCGFYEVSISLNHQVNELLVGLVSAIKAANEHVNEERQRLSRIASIKADPSEVSGSAERSGSFKQKLHRQHRHSSLGKNIRHFFKKHFSFNGT